MDDETQALDELIEFMLRDELPTGDQLAEALLLEYGSIEEARRGVRRLGELLDGALELIEEQIPK
jgi:hypothetical protein